jgi:hypothetical protein
MAQHDDHYLLSFRKDVSFLCKVTLKQHAPTTWTSTCVN